jgi:hypothetical protein
MEDVSLPPGVRFVQDDESVEVTVDLAEGTVRADLKVVTTAESLFVAEKRDDGRWRPLLQGSLWKKVEASSCCWSVEKRRGARGKAVVIQLEKAVEEAWDDLMRADTTGSILEELGRDQVIVDAGADTASSVCGRCGALVKRCRMEAHTTMWCEAENDDNPKAELES